ncbi:MAG: hypothetical protein JSU72_13115 [Deltaproteobacteria bacterium]|nr:MAG: hypothetical protein JSU72_13115 [Deltaproteobacteria bacterium]
MDTGLLITVGVFGLVALFGLIVLLDRKQTKKEESTPDITPKDKMTPEEMWQKHVEELGVTK